jgi:predicted porin
MAQSTVTLYGTLDAGYSNSTKTIAGLKNGQAAVSFNNLTSSKFGFKGTEDLGSGMKANFVIESGISSNPGSGFSAGTDTATTKVGTTIDATTVGNRELNASVDFASGTTVGLGYGGTAIRSIVLGYDAMGGTNFIGNTLTTDSTFSSNRATGVGIRQAVAKGFNVGAAVSSNVDTKDATTDVKTATGYTLNADYANGPLSLAAATQKTKTTANAVSAVAFVFDTTTGGVTSAGKAAVAQKDLDTTTTILAAKYALSTATLFTTFGTVKSDDNGVANTVVKGEGKRSMYNVGVQVPMGNVTLAALYSGGNIQQAAGTTAGEKRDYKGYGIGARYALSKRTMAYVNYGTSKLEAGATAATYKEVKNTETAIGLAHNF